MKKKESPYLQREKLYTDSEHVKGCIFIALQLLRLSHILKLTTNVTQHYCSNHQRTAGVYWEFGAS